MPPVWPSRNTGLGEAGPHSGPGAMGFAARIFTQRDLRPRPGAFPGARKGTRTIQKVPRGLKCIGDIMTLIDLYSRNDDEAINRKWIHLPLLRFGRVEEPDIFTEGRLIEFKSFFLGL